jgi:hypothetical protein
MRTRRLFAAVLLGAIALVAADRTPAAIETVVRATRGDGSTAITQYLMALPHIAYGGGWQTQFVVGNTGSTPTDVTFHYFGDDGNPLSVPYSGVSSTSTALTIPSAVGLNGRRNLAICAPAVRCL